MPRQRTTNESLVIQLSYIVPVRINLQGDEPLLNRLERLLHISSNCLDYETEIFTQLGPSKVTASVSSDLVDRDQMPLCHQYEYVDMDEAAITDVCSRRVF